MKEQAITQYLSEMGSGFLKFGSVRMAMFDIEAGFWGMRQQIEALIGTQLTNSVLQQAGANGGASFASSFGAARDVTERGYLFESCLQAYQVAGFGKFTVEVAQWPVGRIMIHAENAFEAWMTRQHKQQVSDPVCAYTAGVLVGFINVISDRQYFTSYPVRHFTLYLKRDFMTS